MKSAALTMVLAALAASSFGDIQLRRDSVVKVTFDSTVSLRRNHEGDTFTASVAEGPDLPQGSKFLGRVTEIHPAERNRPAYMDLRFEAVRLPDGQTFPVSAVPVKMDYVRRDANGRFRIDQPKVRKENYVLGGLLGGTLLGAILHKPFEGAFVGVLAGIIVGETSADSSAEGAAVHRGDAMGALIQEDARLNGSYSWNGTARPDDPYGRDWNKPRNDDDPFGSNRNPRSGDDPFGTSHRREPRPNPRDASISVGDQSLRFKSEESAYWADQTLMVPLKRVGEQLHLSPDEVNDSHVLYLSNDDMTARFELGDSFYRLNGRKQSLSVPLELRNGLLYGPLDLFSQLNLGTVRLNGTKIEKQA